MHGRYHHRYSLLLLYSVVALVLYAPSLLFSAAILCGGLCVCVRSSEVWCVSKICTFKVWCVSKNCALKFGVFPKTVRLEFGVFPKTVRLKFGVFCASEVWVRKIPRSMHNLSINLPVIIAFDETY